MVTRRIRTACLWLALVAAIGCRGGSGGGGADGTSEGAQNELGLQVLDLTAQLRRTELEARFATLGDHRREAVLLAAPEARTAPLDVPTVDPVLRFAYGQVEGPEGSCLAPVRVRVLIHESGAPPHVAFQEELPGGERGWRHGSLPMNTWAGKAVTLSFEATSGEAAGGEVEECLSTPTAFGDVRVVAGEVGADRRPDLWVVVVDALRADHVGYLSDEAPDTPQLDALAATSFRFTDAITPSSWTREAVYALLSGGYATAALPGIRDVYATDLPGHVPTVPERLRAEGYRTLGIYANAVLSPDNGSERGFDVYAYVRGDGDLPDYLDVLRQESDPRRPLLVYAHLISPHVPYCQHEGITERYLREAGVAQPWPGCVGELEDNRGRPVATRDRATVSAYYRGEVQFADWVVGRLIDQVDTREGDRPSWLMVTSDHGEELWDHGGFEHGHTLYRELLHVPLLIRPPDGHATREGGVDVDDPVTLVDLGDTLAELAGIPSPDETAGLSLVPLLQGEALDKPSERTRLAYGLIYGAPKVALIRGAEKRVLTWDHPPELEHFVLTSDPDELRPGGTADGGERARFAADWDQLERLATSGTATLAVTAAPDLGCTPTLVLDTPAPVTPVTGAGLDSTPLLASTPGTREYRLLGTDEEPLRLQLDGLSEASPPLRVRFTCDDQSVARDDLRLPRGTIFDGVTAFVPTPWWSAPDDSTRGESRSPHITLTWVRPSADLPSISGPDDPLRSRLKELGYVE